MLNYTPSREKKLEKELKNNAKTRNNKVFFELFLDILICCCSLVERTAPNGGNRAVAWERD